MLKAIALVLLWLNRIDQVLAQSSIVCSVELIDWVMVAKSRPVK